MENAQPEPSMEEILASIRRIISEDEDETPNAEAAPLAVAAGAAAAAPVAAVAKPVEPVILQKDDAVEPQAETEDVEMIKENVAENITAIADEAILDEVAASAASTAFANLSESMRVTETPGRTLEDIVVELLKPLVKDWLDANLPAIVEEKVEEEVQRVARRRR